MEVKLASALWKRGYRFRRNSKYVFGKPDFSLKKYRLAIFVDGEYFHGKNWEKEKYRIKTNREFWWKKIEGNIERDKKVNQYLKERGWKVIRFWNKEIEKNFDLCLSIIENQIKTLKDDELL